MNVLVAVPTFETITPDTFKSIWDMDKGGNEVGFEFVRGYDCATARNRIAQITLDGGYDYVLMVDNDVTPPSNALCNLLSHGADFVSGFYMHRNADNSPTDRTCVCKLRDTSGIEYFNYPLESEYTRLELAGKRENGEYLVEIHGGGMGCALVSRKVFEKLRYPWFDWVNYDDRNKGMLSEDLYFCEKMRKKGIRRYVDTRVGCGHLLRRIEGAL